LIADLSISKYYMIHLTQIAGRGQFLRLSFLILVIASLSSCIATKKVAFVDSSKKVTGTYTPQIWSYKIQSGDRFYISIVDPLSAVTFGGGDLQNNTSNQQANFFMQQPTVNDYAVKVDGTVDIAIIGNVKLQGVELDSLPTYLAEKCEGYISNPQIKVFMMNFNVTVLGEVRSPGFYQLITNRPSFFDAIGLAGDLTDFANRTDIQVQRKGKNGQVIVENVNILDPGFISSPYYYLRPNDVIHIRPLKVKKYSTGNALPIILSTITTILTIFTIARSN
jgi:polysaccharide export outer membrane protein